MISCTHTGYFRASRASIGCTECDGPAGLRARSARRRNGTAEQLASLLVAVARAVMQQPRPKRGLRSINSNPGMRLQMVDMQEFARRLSTLGADAFTSDDVVDLATAADVRISADLEIDATLAQRLHHGIAMAATCVFPACGAFGVVLQPGCRRRPG
jgi:hypothetical protein